MNVSASSLQADKFKVSGIVKDATGEPVIGASVVEKGTTNGTVTDLDEMCIRDRPRKSVQ